jgi:hypothetical protein
MRLGSSCWMTRELVQWCTSPITEPSSDMPALCPGYPKSTDSRCKQRVTNMPMLPTKNDQIDSVLTHARTRASAYADDGNVEMAYKSLLRGVQSAQRRNNAGQVGTVLRRLWAAPAVKAVVLTAVPGLIGVLTRSKSKSKPKRGEAGTYSGNASTPRTSRLRLRGRRDGRVEVVDETATPPRTGDEAGKPSGL